MTGTSDKNTRRLIQDIGAISLTQKHGPEQSCRGGRPVGNKGPHSQEYSVHPGGDYKAAVLIVKGE